MNIYQGLSLADGAGRAGPGREKIFESCMDRAENCEKLMGWARQRSIM